VRILQACISRVSEPQRRPHLPIRPGDAGNGMANRTAWPGEERLNRFLASDQRDLFGIDYWNAGRDASRRGHLVYLAGSKRKQSND
jgi:hypothetical protein